MGKILKPPIAQKPITDAGFFNQVWSRFFLGIETESDRSNSNSLQQIMSGASQQSTIQNIQTDLSDTLLRLTFLETERANYTVDIEDLKVQLALSEISRTNYVRDIEDLKLQLSLSEVRHTEHMQVIKDLQLQVSLLNKD